MAEIRVQVAYHFKTDPAKMTAGRVQFPEMITRTVSVGDEMVTEKVAVAALPAADRAVLVAEMEKQIREATRTAKPVGEGGKVAVDDAAPAEAEEMSAF